MELDDITNRVGTATTDESPPVLSPSAPLAALFGFASAEDGCSPKVAASPPISQNPFTFEDNGMLLRPAEDLSGAAAQPQQLPVQLRCTKCRLGKGRCRKFNQPGHLWRPAGAGGGGAGDAARAQPSIVMEAAAAPAPAAQMKKARQKQKRDDGARPDESIVGSRCAVEWQPGEVYEGVIRNVDAEERKVRVQYDDGDKQWENYSEVKLLPTPPTPNGSSEKLIESMKLAGASDEELARALQLEHQKRKSGRERRAVVHKEPPGTSGEPQFASSKPKSTTEPIFVTCTTCTTLYSHGDLGMSAAEAGALSAWTCGVCLGTHEKRSVNPMDMHWRSSNAYVNRDFGLYNQIRGEQWSESQPLIFVPQAPEAPEAPEVFTEGSCILGGSWSAEEDDMLRTMCLTEGTGEWVSKAARFTAGDGRSASSLRQRWAKLKVKDEKAAAKAALDPAKARQGTAKPAKPMKVKLVAKSTKVSTAKALAPKAGTKRPREETVLTAHRNCKTCRIGRGQCRHWNTPGHLQRSGGNGPQSDEAAADFDYEDSGDEDEDDSAGRDSSSRQGSWSAEEDDMLRTMCLTEGTGEWVSKAARFTAGDGRSASSLRQRWAKLS